MKHHMRSEHQNMPHSKHMSGHGLYRNEMEYPHQNAQGVPEHGHGAEEFKNQAMDIAYGQSGKVGMMMDDKRMRAQHKNYHWADSPAEEAPGSY